MIFRISSFAAFEKIPDLNTVLTADIEVISFASQAQSSSQSVKCCFSRYCRQIAEKNLFLHFHMKP